MQDSLLLMHLRDFALVPVRDPSATWVLEVQASDSIEEYLHIDAVPFWQQGSTA